MSDFAELGQEVLEGFYKTAGPLQVEKTRAWSSDIILKLDKLDLLY